MKPLTITLLAVFCTVALTVKAGQIADVPFGTVEMPDGFREIPGQGIDSIVGSFVSADGKLVIYYECGGLGGGGGIKPGKTKEGEFYTEFQAGDHTASMFVYNGMPQRVTVSVGGVSFYAEVRSKEEIGIIKSMVMTVIFMHGAPPHDNVFRRLVSQYIDDERAGEERYQKPFWQAFYRKSCAQTSVGWQPTDFQSPAEMIAYIKQKRRERKLPLYDD